MNNDLKSAKVTSLIQWSESHGTSLSDGIVFSEILDANIGANAPQDDHLLIKVPVKTILKLSDALQSFDFDAALLVKKTRNINAFAKLYLARERSPQYLTLSFFHAYIASLPTSQQINSPYVWLVEDQNMLKGSNLGSSLRENLFSLIEEWWLVISLLPDSTAKPEKHFLNMKFYYEYKFYEHEQLHKYLIEQEVENWTAFPAYLWALMIYKSRSFPSKLLQGSPGVDPVNFLQDDVAMLVPVIDLLNHNPRAQVTWAVENDTFVYETTGHPGGQLFNNYGRKGNEELLLAYGFCLSDNASDTLALKIKVPMHLLAALEENGVTLPKISDYTTSVINEDITDKTEKLSLRLYDEYKDGVVFFITKDNIPTSLIEVFQWLVKSPWEKKPTLRMQLSGLNHLRQAISSKAALVLTPTDAQSSNAQNASIYLKGQKSILKAAVAKIKDLENELLIVHKSRVISLKSIFKKDVKFAQSLMVTMGITSYNDILEQELMDQVWLLYLIRCYNKDHYQDEEPELQYLPTWIHDCFVRMNKETDISAEEVVQFRDLYENLIISMNQAVPEIYNVGKWTIRELVVSTKLLDTIGFVRGKKQECLLVDDFTQDNA